MLTYLVVLVLIYVLDLYCFHIEALSSEDEIEKLIQHIKAKNMKVGIAIKPKTPSSVLYPWISSIDMALVMVHPSPLSAILHPEIPRFWLSVLPPCIPRSQFFCFRFI